MQYFISGHRLISKEEFDAYYAPQIDKVIEEKGEFVIGDYDGVDTMAQQYLFDKGYTYYVTIFHMFEAPRFNAGFQFLNGGYETDEARDNAMTIHSHHDIAWVRPGKEGSGTAQNVMRRSIVGLMRGIWEAENEKARPFAVHKKYRKMFNNIRDHVEQEWAKASETYVEKDDTRN